MDKLKNTQKNDNEKDKSKSFCHEDYQLNEMIPNCKRIKFKASGFAKDSKYSFGLPNFFDQYENKFVGADSIVVNIIGKVGELKYGKEFDHSEDGRNVTINIFFIRYITNKNELSDLPTSEIFYDELANSMDRAEEQYSNKFPAQI